ncbi:MAG: response regulator [bacterium]
MQNDDEQRQSSEPSYLLIADDDPLIQDILKVKLERTGYRVDIAANGSRTLSSIAEDKPDLLILDIKMPELDGFEICRRLRADESTQLLPILILTAYGSVDYIVKGLEAGADDYVAKPFHFEEVLMRIRNLLRLRRVEKELREKEAHLAQVDLLGQILVTMAHHINNSLAIISGRAQVLKLNNPAHAKKLKEVCLTQTRRIQVVMESLEDMARKMRIHSVNQVGLDKTILDWEEDIERRLKEAKS